MTCSNADVLSQAAICRLEQYSLAALAEHLSRVATFSKETLGGAAAWQLQWRGVQVTRRFDSLLCSCMPA